MLLTANQIRAHAWRAGLDFAIAYAKVFTAIFAGFPVGESIATQVRQNHEKSSDIQRMLIARNL